MPFADVELGLRVAAPGGNGALLEATPGYAPAELFQASTATQCFRFLDSQMDFERHEVSLLLRALQGSVSEARVDFFEKVKAVRRRPVGVDWRDTPLARALTTADEFALLASRASASRVRHALRARKMRLLDAFRAFDGEARDGRLSYEALYGGLTWLGVELAPAQMMELAKKIDVDDVGFVTYEQFVDAFGPDDAWTEELSEQEEGDSHAEGEMRREMTEEAFYADADGDGFGAMVSAPKRDDTDLFGLSRVSGAGDTAAAEPYDPLGALGGPTRRDPEVSGSADGWGGEEDLIDFDGAAGVGRAKIEARSLSERATGAGPTPTNLQTNASRSGAPPNNTSSALLSTAAATRGVPLSRDVLSGIRVAIKPHASFARVWTSEATGSRRAASFWHAKFEQSFAARNRDRVPLGSYATPGLSDPSRYAPVNASTGALGPAGKHANALEVTDTKAWAMAGSPYLKDVIDALFPHPVRFRQVWGQEWKHVSAFAWAAVPPPGFVALGMALTATNEPPDLQTVRCVPKRWTRQSASAPALVWTNAGGGGRAASVWIVNELGVAHVVLGHEPPEKADCLELIPAAEMLPEDVLAPQTKPTDDKSSRKGEQNAPRGSARLGGLGSVSSTAVSGGGSDLYGSTSGDRAPPLRGRAAMFESVAEERRREQAARDARERDAREREERRRVAALGASSGADIFAGAFDVFGGGGESVSFGAGRADGGAFFGDGESSSLAARRPALVSVAPAAPSAATQAQRAADANPFAAKPAPIPGMDLLTSDWSPGPSRAGPGPAADADPLGALDPLGAGAPVRVKKEPAGVFGAAAARRSKKAE